MKRGGGMNKLIIFMIISFVFSGCGQKKVDSTNDESFKKSMEEVEKSLNENKKKDFESAVQTIAFSKFGNIFEAAANPDGMQMKIKESLNGKTADAIITEGKQIQAEQIITEVKELKVKIAELKAKELKAEQDKEKLKQFEVERSRFYFNNDNPFITQAVIELTVKNNTKYPVSKAYFHGILATPGRSIPWVEDDFNYAISGGLEPGEEVTWHLSPNMFGGWSNAPKDRNDMVLTVSVNRIDGADEKPIFEADFSKSDKEELETSINRLGELQKDSAKL
jgi:hypothetical protein